MVLPLEDVNSDEGDGEPFMQPKKRKRRRGRNRQDDDQLISTSWLLHQTDEQIVKQITNPDNSIVNLVSKAMKNLPDVFVGDVDVVVYGLGSIRTDSVSRKQLSFIIMLRQKLSLSGEFLCFDPILKEDEYALMKEHFNIDQIGVNEECARQVSKPTLAFMPHCDLPMYNNLLWANWSRNSIDKIVIIGNSMEGYDNHLFHPRHMAKFGPSLGAARNLEIIKEVCLVGPNPPYSLHAFSDTSILTFEIPLEKEQEFMTAFDTQCRKTKV